MSSYQIETERLLIREWNGSSDRSALLALSADAEMMRYITGGEPWSEAQLDRFFLRQAANLEASGMCVGALCLRDSGRVIGNAGVQMLDRMDGSDLAWWVGREFWGQGYATEAAQAICRYAFDWGRAQRLYACIDADNRASRRVADKLGMRLSGVRAADQTASWRPPNDVLIYMVEADMLPAARSVAAAACG